MNCTGFFYQWRVKVKDTHKLTVVNHRGQESFDVAVMGYKNSPSYVQRQIDTILWSHRQYAKVYIDDITIWSYSLKNHIKHLTAVFSLFQHLHITLSHSKSFLGYPSVTILGQKVDSFGMVTAEQKIEAISHIVFPESLRDLERYLGLTGWLRNYIPYYAQLAAPLQWRKMALQ